MRWTLPPTSVIKFPIVYLCCNWFLSIPYTCSKRNIHWWKNSSFLGICASKCSICTDTSIPPPPRALSLFVFRSTVRGGGVGGSTEYLRCWLPLPVPCIPLPSLYQAEVTGDSLFPSHTWQGAEENKKENKGRWLSNYKQLTRLMHCVVQSKGQYPQSCIFLQCG